MPNWKVLLTPSTIPLFLSFLIGLTSFVDATVRLFLFYTANATYPFSAYVRPVLYVGQMVLFFFFVKAVRFSNIAESLNRETRRLLVFHLLLMAAVVIVFFSNALAGWFGFGLSGQLVDTAWLASFWIGPSLISFWIAANLLPKRKILMTAAFFAIGGAFALRPFESLYLRTQTYLDFALPYVVIALGTFAPLYLMTAASVFSSAFLSLRFRVEDGWRRLVRNPFVYALGLAVLLPAFLQSVADGLPNLIIRTLGYWSLDYVGADWYAVSMFLSCFVLYIFVVKQLWSKLDDSLSSWLLKLGALSMVWNGVTIMTDGYSSLAGNLLSLDAILTGLAIRWSLSGKDGSAKTRQNIGSGAENRLNPRLR